MPARKAERIANFTEAVTGGQPPVDLVDDGWTEVMWVDTKRAGKTPEEAALKYAIDDVLAAPVGETGGES